MTYNQSGGGQNLAPSMNSSFPFNTKTTAILIWEEIPSNLEFTSVFQ